MRLVGQYSAEDAARELLSILNRKKVNLVARWGVTTKDWSTEFKYNTVFVEHPLEFLRLLHEAYHIKKRTDTGALPDRIRRMIESSRETVDALRVLTDSWVDRHASSWFQKEICEAHKSAVINGTASGSLARGIADIAYTGVTYERSPQAIIANAFREDILRAIEAEDWTVCAAVIYKIAKLFNTVTTESRFEGDEPSEGRPVIDVRTTIYQSPTYATIDQNLLDTMKIENRIQEILEPLGKAGHLLEQWEESELSELEARLETVLPPNPSPKKREGDHSFSMLYLKQEWVELEESLGKIVGDLAGREYKILHQNGRVTPNVWKIDYGDIKVFRKPPKTQHEVVVMVDLSSSVGCWCQLHKENNGYLIFQSAATIAQAFKGRTRVFGFCSDSAAHFIVPLEPGYAPECRISIQPVPPGNPDCIALEFLRDTSKNLGATLAVVISDGMPAGPSPLGEDHLFQHTEELANELAASGVKFCSILVGHQARGWLYPSEVTARIYNVQDIPRISEVLNYISSY